MRRERSPNEPDDGPHGMTEEHRQIFITGTDTGVGKTVVTAALAAWCNRQGLSAGVLKPIETGVTDGVPSDGRFHRHAADLSESLDEIVPVQYEEPLAPSVAAERAERPVPLPDADRAFQRQSDEHDLLFVEGAGGLLVPVNEQKTMADLAAAWRLPILVVARPSLGTLNHTALTVEVARRRGLDVAGIVISGYPEDPDVAERTNPAELERLTDTTVLGKLPHIDGLNTENPPSDREVDRLCDAVDEEVRIREVLPELFAANLFS